MKPNPIAPPAPASSTDAHERLYKAAGNVWAWVGPGYPDLDDPEERDLFMRSVSELAWAYFAIASQEPHA